MKLITYYQTGKIDVFDTATFTATDPFKRDGMNLITEFAIRFDLLEDKNSNEALSSTSIGTMRRSMTRTMP